MSLRTSLLVASVALAFASTAFAGPQSTTAPAKKELTPQQQRMSDCNKQAAGKKGDEHKAFMSACLKGDATPAAKPMTQQEKMKACNADPQAKSLKGDARKQFMSSCLKGDAAAHP
ncbi:MULTISPECIES: PsiF family protein [Dyella]|uniref:Phosphate starvation-inducible protein PsiF n=2 Tax=Dyella TaxID=231454 RepID=A0A4R0YZ70_9GAMM|nr:MULTISPECIES: PsiF family protein [Dyella]TBR40069.1 phosphate starvation-inducible protein PsiF [Dyella terrae]TCI12348.1 phosphate starvation-inducible protein PsiF [Dyella soli]